MSLPEPELIEKMHRYFAVECNNRAWDLTEKTDRSSDEDRELSDCAHAAAYHWSQVGTPVNDARARLLLAEVYAQGGRGPEALALAKECCEFFEREKESTAWDRAFGMLELAYAHAVNGEGETARALLEEAAARGEQLADKGDREFLAASRERIEKRIASP